MWVTTRVVSIATGPDGSIYTSGPPVSVSSPEGVAQFSFRSGGGRIAVTRSGEVLEESAGGVYRSSDGTNVNAIGFTTRDGRAAAPGMYMDKAGGLDAVGRP